MIIQAEKVRIMKFKAIRDTIEKLFNLGIESNTPSYKARGIRVVTATNIITICLMIPQFIQMVFTYYNEDNLAFRPGLSMVILTVSIFLLISGIVLGLLHIKYHLLAKLISMNLSAVLIFLWTLFNGHEYQFQIYILSILGHFFMMPPGSFIIRI